MQFDQHATRAYYPQSRREKKKKKNTLQLILNMYTNLHLRRNGKSDQFRTKDLVEREQVEQKRLSTLETNHVEINRSESVIVRLKSPGE